MTTLQRGGLPVSNQQAAVVDHVVANPVTVVAAGAGAGKTHTTVAAALQLVQAGDASIDQFALITFTNKAADELRARLEKELAIRVLQASSEAERAVWQAQQELLSAAFVGTIHGFCSRILRGFGYAERIAREADVTTARFMRNQALLDAIEEELTAPEATLNLEVLSEEAYVLRDQAAQLLDQLHNRGLDAEQVLARTEAQPDDTGKPYRVALARVVARAEQRYSEAKRQQQQLDAHDLLVRTAQLLTRPDGVQVVQRLTSRYRYVFVDEFQDTDATQKRILDALRDSLEALLVVGDRKQSIYAFRAADVSLLMRLAEECGVQVLPLSLSRRPTQELLTIQNALFDSMGDRYPELAEALDPPDEIRSGQGGLPPVRCVSAGGPRASREDRIRATAAQIRDALQGQVDAPGPEGLRQVRPGDIAVLFRSNATMQDYAARLPGLLRGVTRVQVDTGGQFFQKPEVVATYRMVRLALHYPDVAVLSQALRTAYLRDVDAAAQEAQFLQYGTQEGHALTDWFENNHANHARALANLRAAVRTDTVPQWLARLYEAFGIQGYYRDVLGDRQAAENLEKLREMARRLFGDEQALTLRQFAQWLQMAYLTDREEGEAQVGSEPSDSPPYVRLMTVHRAKGLEFPVVIIPEVQVALGSEYRDPSFLLLEDGGLDIELPIDGVDTRSRRFAAELAANRQARIEEEMRIFYVAVTRAQCAVIFIGSGKAQPNPPDSDWYSWRDELLRARQALEQNGAVFT
jgi:DNA helicase-2/ATP-dependent DNA helicase PcrA